MVFVSPFPAPKKGTLSSEIVGNVRLAHIISDDGLTVKYEIRMILNDPWGKYLRYINLSIFLSSERNIDATFRHSWIDTRLSSFSISSSLFHTLTSHSL